MLLRTHFGYNLSVFCFVVFLIFPQGKHLDLQLPSSLIFLVNCAISSITYCCHAYTIFGSRVVSSGMFVIPRPPWGANLDPQHQQLVIEIVREVGVELIIELEVELVIEFKLVVELLIELKT